MNPGASCAGARKSSLLARFWRPRYWPTWLLIGCLALTAMLPWRLAIKIHKGLGYLFGLTFVHRRRIVTRNLEICFPELSRSARRKLAMRHFQSLGAILAELAFAWFRSPESLSALFAVEGLQHLEAALLKGKGVILYAGHFTTLEICIPVLKSIVPSSAFMFSKRSNALIDEIQTRGRREAAHESFAATNIRAMLRCLRNNGVVCYLSDQVYRGKNSVLLPFFGEPAMTNTSTSKLIRISGAQLIPFSFYRRADDSGYTLRFGSPPAHFPGDDIEQDTRDLVSILEQDILECPEQYFWTHRRFRGRPSAYSDVYAGL